MKLIPFAAAIALGSILIACGGGGSKVSDPALAPSAGGSILHLPEGDYSEQAMRDLWRVLMKGSPDACADFRGKTDAQALQAVKDGYAIEDPKAHVQEADDASLLRLAQIYQEECDR